MTCVPAVKQSPTKKKNNKKQKEKKNEKKNPDILTDCCTGLGGEQSSLKNLS